MANRKITKDVSDSVIAGAVMANFYLDKKARLIEAHDSDRTKVVVNKGGYLIPLPIGDHWFLVDAPTEVSSVGDLDVGSVENGKDYNVYAVTDGSVIAFKASKSSTWPDGYDATNSRKIGGFHTLCADVGTIGDHALTGFESKDVLPASIWDLKHRARCGNNAGMVYDASCGLWIDIYLPSGTGASTASVFGGTIIKARNWMDSVDDGGAVGKRLLGDGEFQLVAKGSNEKTNIAGSADPGTTGGHADTASRRMISHIGLEDCCGCYSQWLQDQSYRFDAAASHTHSVAVSGVAETVTTGNPSGDVAPVFNYYTLPGDKGSLYRQGTYGDVKLRAGLTWAAATSAGSRGRHAGSFRWAAASSLSSRFASEQL